MEIPNAFVGRTSQPSAAEVAAALGQSEATWRQLTDWLTEQRIDQQEWQSVSPKWGWGLRLKVKKRTIVYLGPCRGCFRVSFVLGGKAVAAAGQAGLPKRVKEAVDAAPRYAEGTGLRLIVKRASDLPAIRKLTLIKLAN